MTENDIELFIKKARCVFLSPEFITITSQVVPGNIRFLFNYEDITACIETSKYLRKICEGKEVHAAIKQVSIDRVDVTFIINTTDAIVLNIKNMECPPDIISTFLKKQPSGKPVAWLLLPIRPGEMSENMQAIMKADMKTGESLPIQMVSWEINDK